MGNRYGSPPDTDEQTEEQPQDDTRPTSLDEAVEDAPTAGDDDSPDDEDGSGVGGGGGGPVTVPSTPESPGPDVEEPEIDELDEDEPEVDEPEVDEPEVDGSESDAPDRDDELDEDEFELVYGDIVQDRETDLGEEDLVVITLPDDTIAEWEYVKDETLADRNPGYPPTDDVIITVERETLDDEFPDWDEREEEMPVDELDVEYTAFPSLRLVLENPSHLRT